MVETRRADKSVTPGEERVGGGGRRKCAHFPSFCVQSEMSEIWWLGRSSYTSYTTNTAVGDGKKRRAHLFWTLLPPRRWREPGEPLGQSRRIGRAAAGFRWIWSRSRGCVQRASERGGVTAVAAAARCWLFRETRDNREGFRKK